MKIQEKIIDDYEAALDELQEYRQELAEKHSKVNQAIDALQDYADLEEADALVPITNGVFVHARIQPQKGLRINAGNGVITPSSIEEAIDLLQSRREEIENSLRGTEDKILKIYKDVESL